MVSGIVKVPPFIRTIAEFRAQENTATENISTASSFFMQDTSLLLKNYT
jgi:hypothetical protein